jgi:hypothetical protein
LHLYLAWKDSVPCGCEWLRSLNVVGVNNVAGTMRKNVQKPDLVILMKQCYQKSSSLPEVLTESTLLAGCTKYNFYPLKPMEAFTSGV